MTQSITVGTLAPARPYPARKMSKKSWDALTQPKWLVWLSSPEGREHRRRFLAREEFLAQEEARLRAMNVKVRR